MCRDLSDYGELTYITQTLTVCISRLEKTCEEKTEERCLEVTELDCDVELFTDCSLDWTTHEVEEFQEWCLFGRDIFNPYKR